jgi:DNA mismatch repair protein PMS2
MGTRLEYDHSGLIKSRNSCARSPGTTVSLANLFQTLPVRHKEFLKNLKRDYNKAIQVIQCYCLISENVKLSCFHIVGDKSTKLMSTHSKSNLKDNLIEIFGLSSFGSMLKFEQSEPSSELLNEFNNKSATSSNEQMLKRLEQEEKMLIKSANDSKVNDDDDQNDNEDKDHQQLTSTPQYSQLFKLEGFISNCAHNAGRTAPDRQHLYINRRPCDHARLVKLINEVYHQFNRTQYPMFVLNMSMHGNNVDVNVTPDKLQMFIRGEWLLMAIVKASLLSMYERSMKSMRVESSSFHSQKSSELMLSFFSKGTVVGTSHANAANGVENGHKKLAASIDLDESDDDDDDDEKEKKNKNRKESETTKKFETNVNSKRSLENSIDEQLAPPLPCSKQPKLTLIVHREREATPHLPLRSNKKNDAENDEEITLLDFADMPKPKTIFSHKDKASFFENKIGAAARPSPSSTPSLNDSLADRLDLHMCNNSRAQAFDDELVSKKQQKFHDTLKSLGYKSSESDHDLAEHEKSTNDKENESSSFLFLAAAASSSSDVKEAVKEDRSVSTVVDSAASIEQVSSMRKCKTLKFDIKTFRSRHARLVEKHKQDKELHDEREVGLLRTLKFKSKNIESKEAESELDRCISKEDFVRMNVCGQFNKGFIIARLDDDLFIIDQHAADEIYNFETLQKSGKIDKQKLLQPKYLELPASAEAILVDNIATLERMGYEMQVCANRKIGNRILITCVPQSSKSNKPLDLRDIDELLFVLSECCDLNPGSLSASSADKSNICEIKSSSLRSMFASKACRKSVMIGDSLNMNEMRRIIVHLNEIDKPWNCPHGRPTMRHLINVQLLKKR